MKLFSKKSTFLIGSIIGSVVGLLFARESGKTLREKLKSARTPQKKFEALFQEYLRVGKSAIDEAQKSETMRELVKGGREILAELKRKAETEGGSAVKFAQKKAEEVLREVEKQAGGIEKITRKKVAATRKIVLQKTAGTQKTVKKAVQKIAAAAAKKGRKKVARAKKNNSPKIAF
ncbi:MAG: YtxH domain-containing protein [Patescibacteria group bacterium]